MRRTTEDFRVRVRRSPRSHRAKLAKATRPLWLTIERLGFLHPGRSASARVICYQAAPAREEGRRLDDAGAP